MLNQEESNKKFFKNRNNIGQPNHLTINLLHNQFRHTKQINFCRAIWKTATTNTRFFIYKLYAMLDCFRRLKELCPLVNIINNT